MELIVLDFKTILNWFWVQFNSYCQSTLTEPLLFKFEFHIHLFATNSGLNKEAKMAELLRNWKYIPNRWGMYNMMFTYIMNC